MNDQTINHFLPSGKRKTSKPFVLDLSTKCPRKCSAVMSSCLECPFEADSAMQMNLFGGAL